MPFSKLGLSPQILRALQESGYTEPTPIQEKVIPLVLEEHDV
ncbi:MAG: DEAD/DEAH box helicase, partial [Thiovulaceae bacterium]|nr:DEAD/DEAH box helicase [Sulfurimonadaceae bacterium]